MSRDDGRTWTDLGAGREATAFTKRGTGAVIAGYHAAVVELKDGRLLWSTSSRVRTITRPTWRGWRVRRRRRSLRSVSRLLTQR